MTSSVTVGCERCNHTGYLGRKGIYELLVVTEAIRVLRSAALRGAIGGFIPDPGTAATDGNTGCASEATGCHTGLSGCGSC